MYQIYEKEILDLINEALAWVSNAMHSLKLVKMWWTLKKLLSTQHDFSRKIPGTESVKTL